MNLQNYDLIGVGYDPTTKNNIIYAIDSTTGADVTLTRFEFPSGRWETSYSYLDPVTGKLYLQDFRGTQLVYDSGSNTVKLGAKIKTAKYQQFWPMNWSTSSAQGYRASASGSNSLALGYAAEASATNSVALGANSVADAPNTVSVGSSGNERRITNVAAGTADTDAVNVGQLNSGLADTLSRARSYTDQKISNTDRKISNIGSRADGGTAAAIAISEIPQTTAPGHVMVGVGFGDWRGSTGVAFGASTMIGEGRVALKAGATFDTNGGNGFGGGVGYQF